MQLLSTLCPIALYPVTSLSFTPLSSSSQNSKGVENLIGVYLDLRDYNHRFLILIIHLFYCWTIGGFILFMVPNKCFPPKNISLHPKNFCLKQTESNNLGLTWDSLECNHFCQLCLAVRQNDSTSPPQEAAYGKTQTKTLWSHAAHRLTDAWSAD